MAEGFQPEEVNLRFFLFCWLLVKLYLLVAHKNDKSLFLRRKIRRQQQRTFYNRIPPKQKSCEFEQIICPLSQDLYFDAKVTK